MKLKTFFIILITLLNYSNQDEWVNTTIPLYEIEKYGSLELNGINGVLIFLQLSEFETNEKIYYYFEFDEDEAINDEGIVLFSFFEGETSEIDKQNVDKYQVYFKKNYQKTSKSIETSLSKTKFYFSSKKNSEYLIIGVLSNTNTPIKNKFKFQNTKKDESISDSNTIVIIIIIVVILIFIGGIIGICIYQKKKSTIAQNIARQDMNNQQAQFVQQPQNGQNVQIYTQQPQYIQEGQYAQQTQNSQQGQYSPMSNEVGVSNKGADV